MTHGSYSTSHSLAIDGQIALHGFPILHAGKQVGIRGEQARIYAELAGLDEHALIATLEGGVVRDLTATHPSVERARSMLEVMFAFDSRYRKVWEIGFGINTQLSAIPGNIAMNEVFGGEAGAVH